MSEPAPAGWELVMPFVVCRSRGGPYEDEAFTAGWALGALDFELSVVAALPAPVLPGGHTVRTASLPQVELIAMKHGYVLEHDPVEDMAEWTDVRFVPSAPVA